MKKKLIYIGISLVLVIAIVISVCLVLVNLEHDDEEDDDHKTHTVVFDSNGGSEVPKQKIKDGELLSYTEFPTREGFLFVGWYTNETFDTPFDFSKPITRSCKLVARWLDVSDPTDTDADGLPDTVEEYYNTDKTIADTDNDRVNDYWEILLGLNPLSDDTDQNGVLDGAEDIDGDTIVNYVEIELGTNPMLADTDGDGLSDSIEINTYNTDALLYDTDDDGANDGWEIENGFDPCRYNSIFHIKVTADAPNDSKVSASVEMYTDGTKASFLSVEPVDMDANPLLSELIPGYMGVAYEFTTCEEIDSATITFEYSTEFGKIGKDFKPRIYYFNQEEGVLEELPNQNVTNGKVSVSVSHFSQYLLLNKHLYDAAWNNNILTPSTAPGSGVNIGLDSNDDGISDYYSRLIKEGKLLSSTGQNLFYGIDFNANADYDNDGLTNGKELQIINEGGFCGRVYYVLKSDPLMIDSDYDGVIDGDDTMPMKWNVSYRDLALLAKAVYSNIPSGTLLTDISNEEVRLANEIPIENGSLQITGTLSELKGWKVISAGYNPYTGFEASAYIKDNNIVIATRGSEGHNLVDVLQDWVTADVIGYLIGFNVQLPAMETFVDSITRMYGNGNYKFHVTGHSLGGFLALMSASKLVENGLAEKIENVITFNALGLSNASTNKYGWVFDIDDNIHLAMIKSKIKNYRTLTDVVSLIGYRPGNEVTIPISQNLQVISIADPHSMSNFTERFSNEIRHPNYNVKYYGLNDELGNDSNSSDSNNSTENNGAVIDTPYYTLDIPQDWLGKFVTEVYDEDDGMYHLYIREKISAELDYPGEIFGLCIEKAGYESYSPNSYIIKSFLKDGEKYDIWLVTPSDFDVAFDGIDNYEFLRDTKQYVLDTLTFKDGIIDITSENNENPWQDIYAFNWEFNESTGTLTLSGLGEMPDYHCDFDPAPWDYLFYSDLVKHIVIEDGLTSIGSFTCWGAEESVTIPKSVTFIEHAAFDCAIVKTIYYQGSEADWDKITIIPQGNWALEEIEIIFLE